MKNMYTGYDLCENLFIYDVNTAKNYADLFNNNSKFKFAMIGTYDSKGGKYNGTSAEIDGND